MCKYFKYYFNFKFVMINVKNAKLQQIIALLAMLLNSDRSIYQQAIVIVWNIMMSSQRTLFAMVNLSID